MVVHIMIMVKARVIAMNNIARRLFLKISFCVPISIFRLCLFLKIELGLCLIILEAKKNVTLVTHHPKPDTKINETKNVPIVAKKS
jgi:hypothetical protein